MGDVRDMRAVDKFIQNELSEERPVWLARRGKRTKFATAFFMVDVSGSREPAIMPVAEGDAFYRYFDGNRRSMTVERFWQLADEWEAAPAEWTLYPTEMQMDLGSLIVVVFAAMRQSDGTLRRVLVDRRYIRLAVENVSDLADCDIDMSTDLHVRIRRKGRTLAVIMPISDLSKTGICEHCAGTGAHTPEKLIADREALTKEAPAAEGTEVTA
jgi:hypothetical protein